MRRAPTASSGSRGMRRRSTARRRRRRPARSRTCRIAEVVNIARALEELKEAGVWTVGLAGDAPKTLRRGRFDAADGARRGGGGHRAAAAGAGAVRLAGVDPDARARSESERVGGGRNCAVRGGPAAAGEGTMNDVRCAGWEGNRGCRNASQLGSEAMMRRQVVARLAQDVLKFTFCSGWRSSVR